MPQHKLSQKSKAKGGTAGIHKKAKKPIKKAKGAPKKGHQLTFAPKKKAAVEDGKSEKIVTKVINQRNEEMIRGRLDHNTGRISDKK
uniref:Uncharacterized protein n=1 Tax=Panagrolaimus sp. ES5 TaxID=591445 RepID=A0AC34GA86_9BILA